jgi:thymidylate kinase
MNEPYYVVGVHCSGKTTLVNRLLTECSFELLARADVGTDPEEPFARAFARLQKYHTDFRRHLEIQKQRPHQRFIGDRCVYDTLAYVHGYLLLGWVDSRQHQRILRTYQKLHSEERPRNIIFLDPPFEWVLDRIKERRLSSSVGWRQDNLDFLKLVMHSYTSLFYDSQKLNLRTLIVKETDLDHRVKVVQAWINSKSTALC